MVSALVSRLPSNALHTGVALQRVSIGRHGGHCDYCEPCRRGDFVACRAAEACDRMMTGKAQFRVVLTTGR